ncbi:MAG: hypothetical protein LBK47_10015 [Prevotellaceae bacterium]|jgi:hypothetical protein|nr:hypothetical protein [Prevotellaceae bacterium]
MKKVLFYTSVAISVMLMATSCIGGGSGIPHEIFIYIAGDTNRTVEISYLAREKMKRSSRDRDLSADGSPAPEYSYGNDNVVITESVTLPFFKQVHAISDADEFLEVTSENDSTTKAIIFGDNLFILRPDSSTCGNIAGNLSNDKKIYPDSPTDCADCMSCKGLTPDSIINYLKITNYRGYVEFSAGDTRKRARLWK